MSDPIHPAIPAGDSVYREKRFSLRVCPPEVTGAPNPRGVIVHGGSVILLPITQDGRIVLIQNRRWQIGQRILELAAGTMEDGENPFMCAQRELREETGYSAGRMELIHTFYALPGLTTEVMHAYLAQDLEHIGQALEADEDIHVVVMTQDDVRASLKDGHIIDGKTMAVLGLYLLQHPQT
jgi:ADP-ribose pyrophosphatase